MISPSEWDTLALLIEEGWPGEFDDAARKAWRVLLDEFDAAQVLTALKLLVSRGGTFRPSVAEVVAEVRRDPSRPTFAEMTRLVFGPGGVLKARPAGRGIWRAGERELATRTVQLDRAEGLHPLVFAFVSRNLDWLGRLDLEGEWAGANRKRLAEVWNEFCEVHEHRSAVALVSGRRGELAPLDPLSALSGVPRRQLQAGSGP